LERSLYVKLHLLYCICTLIALTRLCAITWYYVRALQNQIVDIVA